MNILHLFLILSSFLLCIAARFEPYVVLGVHRRASPQEIKTAYKKMVKEWHPDKNGAPEAQQTFMQITRAYELLSDPDRRRQYDNHGITEDSPNFNRKHDYSQYDRFETGDNFDEFFDDIFDPGTGGGGGRRGGDGEHRVFHKSSITTKAYYQTVVPNSAKKPYLILFYSDWCYTCIKVEPIWARLMEELDPVGFGLAAVHTEHEKELARKIGAKELPHMIMLLDGKVIHYKDPQFSATKTLEFIRRKLPYGMVDLIDDMNVDAFLSGWMDNRVRVLIFGHNEIVRIRYLTAAFKYRNRAAIGFVRVEDDAAQATVERFAVSETLTTLLVFQENAASPDVDPVPVASAAVEDLDLKTILDVVDDHQFLKLPRLSSQDIFDTLCPPGGTRLRKKLCVTLVTRLEPEHEKYRQALRQFLKDFKFSPERVRFTYVLEEKQPDFVNSLASQGEIDGDPVLRVAILWRMDTDVVKMEWLKDKWSYATEESSNRSRKSLRTSLQRLLTSNEILPYETEIGRLVDEHAQSLFVRFASRMIEVVEFLRESVRKDDLMPAVSIVVTIGLIVIGGYIMNFLVKREEESVQRQLGAKGLKVDKKGKVVPELKIHELRAETYNGMVRLLKPGCRTVVMIVDRESKEKLVPKFYKLAWPYRRNKTLMFGFLYIEKGLPWFKKILNLTLPEPRDININPKNCIGTILSLNGHRRYFCMYHAKHPEGSRKRIYTANNGHVAGAFMGLDSEIDSELDDENDVEGQRESLAAARFRSTTVPLLDSPDHLPIFEDQLLDGLQTWMDRLFEGSTYRYHINYWPEFPISPANFNRT